MVKSLTGGWKYPVGYVLIDGNDATNLHTLFSRAMCAEYEVDVQALTMDRTSTNFASIKKFRCNLPVELKRCPVYLRTRVSVIPDAAHMLKLGRNALADLESFIDDEGNKVEWRFITALHQVQEEEGIDIYSLLILQKFCIIPYFEH